MAYVFNRGTKDEPVWHARYKDGSKRWRMIKVPAEYRKKKDAEKWIESQQAGVAAGRPDPHSVRTFADLAGEWEKTLTNRNAKDDRARLKLHLLPHFGPLKVNAIDQPAILDWIDQQRATPKKKGRGNLSDASVRHHLNLLSRFFAWCVPRHLQANPVRDLPQGKRPQASATLLGEAPWIEDDKTVRELYRVLPSPYGLMFYIGNRTGMRLGEICGLRLSSFDNIDRGAIRVRYTYDDGFLKEDKRREGKSKAAPAPADLIALVKPWIEQRKAAGATSESLMFPNPRNDGKAYQRLALERAWHEACAAVKFTRPDPEDAEKDPEKRRQLPRCTWYEGTRHSFASRILRDTRGRALYEVARALGHRDTSMIAKHYGRWIVTEFSAELTAGIGLKADQAGAPVLPMRRPA